MSSATSKGVCPICSGPLFSRNCLADHKAVRMAEESHRAIGETHYLKWQQEHLPGKSSVSVAYRVGPAGSIQIWRPGKTWPSWN